MNAKNTNMSRRFTAAVVYAERRVWMFWITWGRYQHFQLILEIRKCSENTKFLKLERLFEGDLNAKDLRSIVSSMDPKWIQDTIRSVLLNVVSRNTLFYPPSKAKWCKDCHSSIFCKIHQVFEYIGGINWDQIRCSDQFGTRITNIRISMLKSHSASISIWLSI